MELTRGCTLPQASLVRCPGCSRSFRPEALEHHIKGCKGSAPAPTSSHTSPLAPTPAALATPRPAAAGTPRGSAALGGTAKAASGVKHKVAGGYVCFLCGSQFGSASLQLHIKQCQARWDSRVRLPRLW